jgi:hypothetical protein
MLLLVVPPLRMLFVSKQEEASIEQ